MAQRFYLQNFITIFPLVLLCFSFKFLLCPAFSTTYGCFGSAVLYIASFYIEKETRAGQVYAPCGHVYTQVHGVTWNFVLLLVFTSRISKHFFFGEHMRASRKRHTKRIKHSFAHSCFQYFCLYLVRANVFFHNFQIDFYGLLIVFFFNLWRNVNIEAAQKSNEFLVSVV